MIRYRNRAEEESESLAALSLAPSSFDFLPEAPAIRSLVYAVARRPVQIEIHPSGINSFFDPSSMKISLELPPDGLNRLTWRAILYARALHEAAHCRYLLSTEKKVNYKGELLTPDMAEYRKFTEKVKANMPGAISFAHNVFNILLDAVHEDRLIQEMPVLTESLRFYRRWLLYNSLPKIKGDSNSFEEDLLNATIQAIRCKGLNTDISANEELKKAIVEIFHIYKKVLQGEVGLAEGAWHILSYLGHRIPNLEKYAELLGAPLPDLPKNLGYEPTDKPPDEGAEKSTPGNGEKIGVMEPSSEKSVEIAVDGSSGLSVEEKEEKELSELFSPESFQPEVEARVSLQSLMRRMPQIPKSSFLECDEPRNFNAELSYAAILRREGLNPIISRFWGVAAIVEWPRYRKFINSRLWNMTELNRMASYLAHMIKSILKEKSAVTYGYRGSLDVTRYLRVGLPYERSDVFKLKVEEKPPQEKVLFAMLIDTSGSMAGVKVENSAKTAYVVSKALSLVGIKHGIFSWTDFEDERSPWEERTEVWVIKGFDEPLNDKVVSVLRGLNGYRNNSDHIAIESVAELMVREATQAKKVLFVLSDGLPESLMYYHIDGIKMTKNVVDYYRSQGFYIGSIYLPDSPYSRTTHHEEIYGKEHLWIADDVSKLPEVFRELLKKLAWAISD